MKQLQIIIFCAFCSLSTIAQTSYTYRYWFDQSNQVVTSASSATQFHVNADVSGLSDGLHTLNMQVIQNDTLFSPIFTRNFIKISQQSGNLDAMTCYYMVDGKAHATRQATTISGGNYHFDLDMSSLTDGLHQLTYWLVSPTGSQTSMRTTYFVKTAAGGNGITQLQYWLNDNYANRQVVNYDPRQATVHVATTLTLDQLPIRPSCFKFAVESGDRVIYARNDLHLMFFDANYRIANSVHEFIDTRTRQVVVPVAEAVESQKFQKIAASDIRWYTITLSEDEVISLRTSCAATLQLFSPSASEVYKSEGTASTTAGTCQATETGIYYLAIHTTGTTGTSTLYVEKISNLSGDVNCDGTVSGADVVALVRHILGLETCQNPQNADLNNDNDITLADVTALVNMIKP